MKSKSYNEDSENEFELFELEELQENSNDNWVSAERGSKRPSTGKRGPHKKKNKKSISKTPTKSESMKTKNSKKDEEDGEDLNDEEIENEETEDEDVDEEDVNEEEEVDEEEEDEEENINAKAIKLPEEFTNGAFVVLKSDFDNDGDPPIWKIDGKMLLQKYVSFEQDGKTFYKNTSVYTGWSINNKDKYYPATVTIKQHNRKEHIVEFQRHLIQNKLLTEAQIGKLDELYADIRTNVSTNKDLEYVSRTFEHIKSTLASSKLALNISVNKSNNRSKCSEVKPQSRSFFTTKKKKVSKKEQ